MISIKKQNVNIGHHLCYLQRFFFQSNKTLKKELELKKIEDLIVKKESKDMFVE